MKQQLERADKVIGELVEGRRYLVPTVKGEWLDTHGIADWPVVGIRHKDPDLGANVSHYHIDMRFVPEKDFTRDENTVVNESCDAPLRYKPWLCRQARVVITKLSARNAQDFFAHYVGRRCSGSKTTGWICPHKQTWLGSQTVVAGVITCPSHGLPINAKTGHVLPIKDAMVLARNRQMGRRGSEGF